jgi:hypothetical protein
MPVRVRLLSHVQERGITVCGCIVHTKPRVSSGRHAFKDVLKAVLVSYHTLAYSSRGRGEIGDLASELRKGLYSRCFQYSTEGIIIFQGAFRVELGKSSRSSTDPAPVQQSHPRYTSDGCTVEKSLSFHRSLPFMCLGNIVIRGVRKWCSTINTGVVLQG